MVRDGGNTGGGNSDVAPDAIGAGTIQSNATVRNDAQPERQVPLGNSDGGGGQ